MTLRNRVTPLGEFVADPARGLVYGNRGCLHDDAGNIKRDYAVRRWISCQLDFRDRRRKALLQPGRYTELFFLDEATAFAAGHRPCAECRREDYVRFLEIWHRRHAEHAGADAVDVQLHAERLDGKARRIDHVQYAELPDGAFVLVEGEPWLVLGERLRRYTPAGYDRMVARPSGTAQLITPPSLLDVLAANWSGLVPLLHPSAYE
ncbi:MAG TPA: hypothetical protein VGL76_11170 [Gaiellaceae bacterium]